MHGAGPATAVQAPAQAGKPTGKAAAKGAATGAAKKPAPCTGKGMSTSANEKEFAGDMNKLQTDWPKLKPSERQAAITAAANKQLIKTGAPPVTAVNNPKLGPTRLGELDFQKWSLSLNPKLTSSASLSKAQSEELGSTVFHETRHANQWYMMAQNQAGSGKSASDIASTTFLPANVARKAAANPIKKGDPLFDCSNAMQQSVYGSGATHREQTLTDLRTTGDANVKANSALDAINANPKATAAQRAKALSDANAAYTKAKKANDLYRALPEEADAWQSGDAVGALLH